MSHLPSSPLQISIFLASLALALYAALLTWSRRTSRGGQPTIDWAEALFVSLVSVVAFGGWAGTILASLGAFSLAALAAILLAGAALLLWLQRPAGRPAFARPGPYEVGLGLLLLGSSIVTFRPHEYVLGGADAGVYMNMGATLAQTGDFIVSDEWTAFLRQHAGVTLRQQPAYWEPDYLQLVGWYIDDENPARVIPQFFPFHPVLIAVGISLAALTGGLLVTPLWAVLGLAAVYFLGRALFDRATGLLAAILLATTATHIYFARYPTTEPLTLLLVFSGLLACQRLWDERHAAPLWGLFGGATFGAAFLTRIDLPVLALLIFLLLLFVWQRRRWSRGWTAFAIAIALFTLHATLSALLLNWPYTWNTYSSVLRVLAGSRPLLVAGGLLATTALLFLLVGRRRRWLSSAGARLHGLAPSPRLRRLAALCVILLSAYAYFLRPVWEPAQSYSTWPAGTEALLLNGENWVRLGWYLTPLGLLLATLGLAWILWSEPLPRLAFFLAVGVLTTVQYVYNIFNTPYHIYAMRRYVPIVIPMLMLYAAVGLLALLRRPSLPAARALGALLAVALLAGLLYQARFVLPLRDMRGAVEQVTALNEQLHPDAIIVFAEPATAILADTFGAPLRYTFGHDIATIRRDDASVLPFIDELLAVAAARGQPVQLLAVEPVAPVVREALALQPAGPAPVSFQMLMNTFTDFPSTLQTVAYGLEIYDVQPAGAAERGPAPITIDIGTLDAAYIRTGFYYKEPLPGPITMRWTGAVAAVDVPMPGEGPVTIAIRALTYRPADLSGAEVAVRLDGQLIGHFVPERDLWQTFTFQAEARPEDGLSLLEFETATFNPATLGLSADSRDLGFLLDWVSVAPD